MSSARCSCLTICNRYAPHPPRPAAAAPARTHCSRPRRPLPPHPRCSRLPSLYPFSRKSNLYIQIRFFPKTYILRRCADHQTAPTPASAPTLADASPSPSPPFRLPPFRPPPHSPSVRRGPAARYLPAYRIFTTRSFKRPVTKK